MNDKQFWNTYYRERAAILSESPDELLIEEVSTLSPGLAVDFGAGSGHNSVWLAEQGWQVQAVDYAQSAVDLIRNTARKRSLDITAVCADITTFTPDTPVDLVCICYIHVPAPEVRKMLMQASAILSPGGSLLYIGILRQTSKTSDPSFNALCTTPEELITLLPKKRIIRSETQHRSIPIDEGEYFQGETFILHGVQDS